MTIKGFVNINKPKDMTSSDVVVVVRGILRRVYGEKFKVGHLGTLDPEATGVLPIAVGSATKLFDYAQNKEKVYNASFSFGKETDTLDSAGNFTTNFGRVPTAQEISDIIPKFIGEISQIPPKFSAKSVNGKRAYVLAREGKDVELNAKTVKIFSINLLNTTPVCEQNDGECNTYNLQISCGSGTYIRAIARDFGQKLGTVAYMSALNRIKSGEFTIQTAVTIAEFQQNPNAHILPIEYVLNSLPSYVLPNELAEKYLNGVKVNLSLPNGQFSVYHGNELLGLGEKVSDKLKLIRL